MVDLKKKTRKLFSKISYILLMILFFMTEAYAQRPQNLPYDTKPVGFLESPFNIIVFVVMPICLLLFYIWWIYDKRKKEREEKERIEKEKASKHEDGNNG